MGIHNSNPTVTSGLSASERMKKLWEVVERNRKMAFENPYTTGRVPMGHERLVQVR